MMKGKVHFEANVDGEDVIFICNVGCPTIKALQGISTIRTHLMGIAKEQEEQQKASADAAAAQSQVSDGNQQ